ncbi:protein SMAX1-LIKE 3 isoform X2 [Diospyros lotus]|uniref:protein SMAX1-LIKE 3 isoform X2 n=1 Tax=Diospyros lotus TaxID=55363 RepID=UPI002257314E|nr:protein SMAX1-LIKE 3 isoform X2 [Diospyros lotus]
MRAGGYAMNQSLTSEAANVVKQAVTLARRRGHTQVTPLHVASTMLTSPTGLLRTACLRSNSNPFRCRALELCFNVALNRLPASSAGPMLGPNSHHPSISNALVAAFKRAQAHQRRGSIENQQQPLLAVKIELDQLIISILDDPSVSRVMREAGFSSTQVKADVEKAVALELSSQTLPTDNNSKESNFQVGKGISRPRASSDNQVRNEDVMSVIETMLSKKRKSIVLVGECLATIEGVVRGVMDKVDRGEVPEAFRELKFISLPLNTLENVPREELERRLGELRCLVKSCVDKGIVFYLEDLHWTTEYRAGSGEQRRKYYCPVEYMIIELGRLVSGIEESGRFWLLGIATFQTYRRCKTGHPSLETIWGLHPLTIPEGSLSLSLNPDSDAQSVPRTKKAENRSNLLLLGGNEKQLSSCLAQCSTKFENEARSFNTCTSEATTSSLPLWLQKYKDENQRLRNTTDQVSSNNDQESVPVRDLCEKWNSFCSSSAQRQPYLSERTITFSSASPSCSTSAISYPNFHHAIHWSGDQHFSTYEEGMDGSYEPSFRIYSPQPKQLFLSNPSSTHNSASSSDTEAENPHRFKEMNSENFKTLCNALEKEVPWHKEIIPEITSTILRCRSGMVRRKGDHTKSSCEAKEETWLFFQGLDVDAKERIARELARLVFGSHSDLVSITLSSFSSTRADSVEDLRNKRSRDEQSCSYLERFAEAVSVNPHRVFLVEDVEQADYCSQMGIKRAIERGRIMSNSNGKEVSLHDAIVILSCESFSSRSRACSPPSKQKSDGSEEEKEIGHCVSLDLNVSFDQDDNLQDNQSIDDIGLLDSVDGRILFKLQDL